ncbi:MAG: hypothetical protein ACI8P9_003694 [Parasphingorhabdus sp.]|jgi:hypothetical protein
MRAEISISRRLFLQRSTGSLLCLSAINLNTSQAASELPKLEQQSEAAVQLGYSHDAKSVNTGLFPKRTGDGSELQFCNTCQFFSEADNGWGHCAIFPENSVNSQGWCNSWYSRV